MMQYIRELTMADVKHLFSENLKEVMNKISKNVKMAIN